MVSASSSGSGEKGERQGAPGTVVAGRYVLIREIGHGAMGTVFESVDQRMGRRVAIKLHNRDCVQPKDAGRQFRREARAAASIQHPNVVITHDAGKRRDGTYYIVQELLLGVTLRQHLNENRCLGYVEALDIMIPIMGALIAAHRKNVIHRDIKPENIFLAQGEFGGVVPKLIDFGIALAPHTLTVRASSLRKGLVGTALYMSPEQVRDDAIDGRSDVWATATVLFELLHGTPPLYADTFMGVMTKIVAPEPVPRITTLVEGVPSELADILERALARKAAHRYPTMDAFLAALLGFSRRSAPWLAQAHAASVPRYVESPPPPHGADAPDEVPPPSTRLRFPRQEPEPVIDPLAPTLAGLDLARRAEEYLRVNALDDALEHAAKAIQEQGAGGELYGRMRQVQASAARWLGRFAEAERWARDALAHLPRGSARWYKALGHLALVCGYLGKNEDLPALSDDLGRLEVRDDTAAAHIRAGCRLVVSLVRAGRIDLASHVFNRAQGMAANLSLEEPDVLAWLDVANAEFELHRSNMTTALQLLEAAVAGFVQAGAVRNACLQRRNIGAAYMRLGLYQQAEQTLRNVVLVGESMRLNFIAPARVDLGFALARLGDLDQAREIESAALDHCIRQGNRRFEAISRLYLAEILRLQGDTAAAEEQARLAVTGAAGAPAVRAHALAMLADLLLQRGRAAEALPVTGEAMTLLESLEGVGDGESLIRLVHALALEATGDVERAAAHARSAKQRILDLANSITEPTWRRSFLDNVPENARTCALVPVRP